MASVSEKQLQDDILQLGSKLHTPPADVDELLSLLTRIDIFLSRVDQSPFESMFAALQPTMKALVAKDLLEHPDVDVKVHVAACVTEITRITAPDAPYDDDQMKVIFQMIVEAFRNLDDVDSRSFTKRLTILDTVAKVRSCVVMLDLGCDDLILEMFHNFLKAIRPNLPECVFHSMVMIMTLVLEESEYISSELLSCLLNSIKDNKEALPIARRLGEKVISNCAAKLKPYLVSYAPGGYSKIVGSICQGSAGALEPTEINGYSEIMAEDNKLSERTVSDEPAEGSTKLDQEVASPENVGTSEKSLDRSPRLSNGILQRGSGDSVVQPASPKQKPERPRCSGQPKSNVSVNKTDSDNLGPEDAKSDVALDLNNKPKKGRDSSEVVQTDSGKDAPSMPSIINGHNKEVDSSQLNVIPSKEAEPSISIEHSENVVQESHSSDNGAENVTSLTHSGNDSDITRPKRGRPPGSKAYMKKCSNSVLDQSTSAPAEKEDEGASQAKEALSPSKENDLKKKLEPASNSVGESHRNVGKKVPLGNIVDAVTPNLVASDSEAKPTINTGKRGNKKKEIEGESSRKQRKSNTKRTTLCEDWYNHIHTPADLRVVDEVTLEVQMNQLVQHAYALTLWSKGVARRMLQGEKVNAKIQYDMSVMEKEVVRLRHQDEIRIVDKINMQKEIDRYKAEAGKAVERYRCSSDYRFELQQYVNEHSEMFFRGGWDCAVSHICESYPDLDPAKCVDPCREEDAMETDVAELSSLSLAEARGF